MAGLPDYLNQLYESSLGQIQNWQEGENERSQRLQKLRSGYKQGVRNYDRVVKPLFNKPSPSYTMSTGPAVGEASAALPSTLAPVSSQAPAGISATASTVAGLGEAGWGAATLPSGTAGLGASSAALAGDTVAPAGSVAGAEGAGSAAAGGLSMAAGFGTFGAGLGLAIGSSRPGEFLFPAKKWMYNVMDKADLVDPAVRFSIKKTIDPLFGNPNEQEAQYQMQQARLQGLQSLKQAAGFLKQNEENRTESSQ